MQQNRYMEAHEQRRCSQGAIRSMEESNFDSWPLPMRHEKMRICSLLVCSITLLALGIDLFIQSGNVVSQSFTYSEISGCAIPAGQFSEVCQFNITVDEDMKSPVFVYYHLTKFWQNHFLYVRSISEPQIFDGDLDDVDVCKGSSFGGELYQGVNDRTLVPCGLQGWSVFDDEVSLNITTASGATRCNDCLSYENIALDVDLSRFPELNLDDIAGNFTSIVEAEIKDGIYIRGQTDIPDLHDESLMVWMRYAPTSNFKKIHSKILHDLQKDDVLEFTIDNKFNTHVFQGSKGLVVSETGPYGGKHIFLATIFTCAGAIPLAILVAVLSTHAWLSMKNGQRIW